MLIPFAYSSSVLSLPTRFFCPVLGSVSQTNPSLCFTLDLGFFLFFCVTGYPLGGLDHLASFSGRALLALLAADWVCFQVWGEFLSKLPVLYLALFPASILYAALSQSTFSYYPLDGLLSFRPFLVYSDLACSRILFRVLFLLSVLLGLVLWAFLASCP